MILSRARRDNPTEGGHVGKTGRFPSGQLVATWAGQRPRLSGHTGNGVPGFARKVRQNRQNLNVILPRARDLLSKRWANIAFGGRRSQTAC